MHRVMLVEDNRHVSHALVRRFSDRVDLVVVETVREAEARLHEGWSGIIVDRGLPDGDGLALAKRIAAERPGASVLVFSGADPIGAREDAATHGIIYADKADGPAIVDRMITTWAGGPRPADGRRTRLAVLAAECALSPREVEVLRCRLAGQTRSEAARALGITEDTHKSHVTAILKKTKFERLAQLVAHLMRDV